MDGEEAGAALARHEEVVQTDNPFGGPALAPRLFVHEVAQVVLEHQIALGPGPLGQVVRVVFVASQLVHEALARGNGQDSDDGECLGNSANKQ